MTTDHGLVDRAVKPTRAQKRILAACADKGIVVTALWWEPWEPANEMEGIGGGWTIETSNSRVDGLIGLNVSEAVEFIERFGKLR